MELRSLLLRIRALFFRQRLDDELEEEIRAHLELQTRKHILAGLPEHEAKRRAQVALGGRARTVEECRDQRSVRWIENFARDCKFALRAFRRAPGFALTVVLTMAVIIGANTTVFSFSKAMLLATLPIPNPQDIYLVSVNYPGASDDGYFSFPDLRQMEPACVSLASLTGFTDVVGFHIDNASGTSGTIKGQLVTPNFFSALQGRPIAGRLFEEQDNRTGASAVAVASYQFWQGRFGDNLSAVGRTILIQQTPVTIIAVMPRGFEGVEPGAQPDLWMPLSVQSQIGYQGYGSLSNADWRKPWLWQDVSWLHVIARSYNDRNGNRLNTILNHFISSQVAAQLPHVTDSRQRAMMLAAKVKLTSAAGGLPRLRKQFSLPLQILTCLVGLLLLCGCVNLMNLLLARSRAQQHEIALRIALGSSRARLIASHLTETTLLVVMGGLSSLPLTYWGDRMILYWLNTGESLAIDVGADWSVFAFAAFVTLLSGLAIAIIPALQTSDFAGSRFLGQRGGNRIYGDRRSYGKLILPGGQLAVSVISLVLAGLLTHTLVNYAHLNLGMDRGHVLSVSIDPSAAGYNGALRLSALYRELITRIDRIPGVSSSSVGGCGLMAGTCATIDVSVVGRRGAGPNQPVVERNYVGPRYFSTVGMDLLRGREISERDTVNVSAVGVVNREFEQQLLDGRSAIGQMAIQDNQAVRIVGVVRDARSDDIHAAAIPFLYLPVQQAPGGWNVSHIEVRAKTDPGTLAAAVRTAILNVDRGIPISEVVTLEDETNRGLARESLVGRLAGLFSLLTLVIAAIGLYGMLAHYVGQKRAETAVRMALGASRAVVVRPIAAQAVAVWAVGSGAGLLMSTFASGFVTSLLFGTARLDLWTYSGALVTLLVVSLLAALVPAVRAVNIVRLLSCARSKTVTQRLRHG